MRNLFIILFTLVSLTCYSQEYTYELAGQSNAAGLGLRASLPGDLNGAISNAYIYNNASSAFEQLNADYSYGGGNYGNNGGGPPSDHVGGGPYYNHFGIEMRLMKLLATHYGARQNLIKYAVGGTALYYSPGTTDIGWSPEYPTTLSSPVSGTNLNKYSLFHGNTLIHNNAYTALGGSPILKAYIWIQGENDAETDAASAAYQTNLEAFISAKRTAYSQSTLPFIIVRMSDNQTYNGTYKGRVQTAQTNVGGQSYNSVINTNDLAVSDGAHYTEVSSDSIANRVFRAIIANDGSSNPPSIQARGRRGSIVNIMRRRWRQMQDTVFVRQEHNGRLKY